MLRQRHAFPNFFGEIIEIMGDKMEGKVCASFGHYAQRVAFRIAQNTRELEFIDNKQLKPKAHN